MTLHPPLLITPRLLPGVRIGDAFVSITYSKNPGREGRCRYLYHIDLPGIDPRLDSFSSEDLQSGCQGGSLQEGLASLLSFMSAAGEAYRYEMGGGKSENSDLFPPEIMEFCYQHDDEISMLQLELAENPNLIEE